LKGRTPLQLCSGVHGCGVDFNPPTGGLRSAINGHPSPGYYPEM
jgi:hypothetical protein